MIRLLPIRRNRAGDPVLRIEVSGWYDIYRFARHLTEGQVEFADIGYRVIQRCHDSLGSKNFWRLMQMLWGEGSHRDDLSADEWAAIRRRSAYRARSSYRD